MLCITAVTPAAIIAGVIAVVTAAATATALVMVVAGVVGFVEAVVVVVMVVGVGGVVCSSSCRSIVVWLTDPMTAKCTMSACCVWTTMQSCL